MKVKIKFKCNNASFEDNYQFEIQSICEKIKTQLESFENSVGYVDSEEEDEHIVFLKDINGNMVGKMIVYVESE